MSDDVMVRVENRAEYPIIIELKQSYLPEGEDGKPQELVGEFAKFNQLEFADPSATYEDESGEPAGVHPLVEQDIPEPIWECYMKDSFVKGLVAQKLLKLVRVAA